MLQMTKFARPMLSMTLPLALAACGGGGSGDGGGPSQATLSLDPAGYGERTVAIHENADSAGVLQLYSDMELPLALVEAVRTEVMSWSPSTVDGNALAFACDNAGGSLAVTLDETASRYDERWSFSNCELTPVGLSAVVLNGSARFVEAETGANSAGGYEQFDISGEVSASGERIALKGRQDWSASAQSEGSGSLTYETDALEYLWGNTYVAMADQVMRANVNGGEGEFSMQARIVGSAIEGYVTMSTPTALVVNLSSDCPSAGVVRLESDGFVEVRYGSSTNTAEAVVVELNGSRVGGYNTCAELGISPF